MKKLDYIDALRGLAVLGVMMTHTAQYGSFNVPDILKHITDEGSAGVQLFYIASAFTLFLSFKSRSQKEASPVRNFFIRRFFRIAPMYYIGIVYYLFQNGMGPSYFLGDQTNITPLNITANFLFLHGFYPYWINSVVPGGWSIAVEMTFYAILPFLFLRIKNINQAFNFVVISIVIRTLINMLCTAHPLINDGTLWNNYLYFYFPNHLPVFALGIMTYFIICEEGSVHNLSGKTLLLFSSMALLQLGTGHNGLFSDVIYYGLAFSILCIALSKYRFTVIVNPVIKYIGQLSFSMYLVHFAVLKLLEKLNFLDYFNNGILNYACRYIIVVLLSMLISSVFYKLIEVPFQNIGKRIIKKLENKGNYTSASEQLSAKEW
ncbi:MAG: cellulose-binding, family [Mucilaginibacter sp.]|nr:cellulose-binding, family [Mucilaginibacter sp.]